MPPKGWKKPESVGALVGGAIAGASIGAPVGRIPGELTDAAVMQQAQVGQQFASPAPANNTGFSAHLDATLKSRILACNEIKIVCKTVGKNGVTITHSRHDAEWLKEFV